MICAVVLAAHKGDVAAIRDLIAGGADRAIGDRHGITPIEHARARGFDDLVAILAGTR